MLSLTLPMVFVTLQINILEISRDQSAGAFAIIPIPFYLCVWREIIVDLPSAHVDVDRWHVRSNTQQVGYIDV